MSDQVISVLLNDPDPKSEELAEELRQNGFQVKTARNFANALEELVLNQPAIVLTEINLPGISPRGALNAFHNQRPESVLFVMTSDANTVKQLGPGAAFDMVMKPVTARDLTGHLKRAHEFYLEKNNLLHQMTDSSDRVLNQVEWLLWKEQGRVADKIRYSKALVANIRNSILQGMGIGSLVTRIEMLQINLKEDETHYHVPKANLDQIIRSAEVVHRWLENMDNINRALDAGYDAREFSGSDLTDLVDGVLKNVEKFRRIKRQRIIKGDLTLKEPVIASKEVLDVVLEEIFINAFKYSPDRSEIDLLKYRSGKTVVLAIVNDIIPMQGGVTGIPHDFENQVFEPFFRLNNVYDERFYEETFSMGTGLTVVQSSLRQIGANVRIYEIHDHAVTPARDRVLTEIILPTREAVEENETVMPPKRQ